MSEALYASIAALRNALLAETAALAAGDLRGAAGLGATKAAAIEVFQRARADFGPGRLAGLGPRQIDPLQDLRRAIVANRAALESSIALQGRVIEAIARAGQRADAAASPGYMQTSRAGGALAVSVNA
jgi:hypothetical protein